jgi:deazaflavin-dependent oxidoreductase (nitroreductase family)
MIPPRPLYLAGWALHRALFRVTGGRVGTTRPSDGGGLGTLFLETTGRTSGKRRGTALYYLDDGRNLAVVASNAGADHDPAWWRNLQANRRATVTIEGQRLDVDGRPATEAERARLWPRFVAASAQFAAYERALTRAIPVVILEPVDPGPGG